VVVLRWDSLEALQAWRHSSEYENIRKVGESFAKYNIVAVEGVNR
jgi:heme-degrading monooxygenase HmoA